MNDERPEGTLLLLLDDACLLHVLCCDLSHLDILRTGRVCRRLHGLVHVAEPAWKKQYQAHYGTIAQPAGTSYRQLFKDRCLSDAREQRLQRKLQRYRLQSDVSMLQRELRLMKSNLQSEQQLQQRVTREVKDLLHAKQVEAACTQWHLSSVQLYHNKVMQATPVMLEAELASLQQQLLVSQLEVKTLQSGIKSRQQRLTVQTRQLDALAP